MGFSAGTAFSESFTLLRSRFVPMLVVSILYYVLLAVVVGIFGAGMIGSAMSMGMNPGSNPAAAVPTGFGISLLLFYLALYSLNFFHQSALVRLCSDRHEPNLGDAMATGLRSVPTLLGAALLLIVGLIAVTILLSIVGAAVAMGAQSPGLSFIVGLVMLVALGYMAMRLSMLLPAVAIEEQRNPITAIGRSWDMTKGNTLKLFLLFVGVFLIMGLIGLIMFFTTIGMPQPGSVPSTGGLIGFFVMMVIFGLTVGMWFIALVAAIHRQLAGPSVAAVQETFA